MIDIVIVNWNSGEQLRACIDSIRQYGSSHVGRIVVVDNGSADGSTDFLAGAGDVDLVLTGENLGFGRACNLGAARGDSAFVLFLNPDACLMPGSLDVPMAFFARPESEQIGIVGIPFVNEDGTVQRTCARAPSLGNQLAKSLGISAIFPQCSMSMATWDHSETRAVDQVMGAFFFVRRSLITKLQGFDERFFVYFEEVDFAHRAALAGYGTMYLTEAQAYHKGGGVSEQVKAHRLFYSLRSRIQYAFKHFNRPAAVAVGFATLAVEPLSRLALLIGKRRFGEIGDLGRGYRMLWGWALRGGAPRS
ncbi:MAG: glycosyltransferase family 2 protein [Litorimonas sp.]